MKSWINRFAVILLAGTLLAGCQTRTSESTSVSGQVQIEGHENLEGIQVFIPGTSIAAYTDREGNFVLSSAPAGKVKIVFQGQGIQSHRESVQLASGQSFHLSNPILLKPAADKTGFEIFGRVTLSDGKDSMGSGIFVVRPNHTASTTVDASGMFQINVTDPGSYQVQVFRTGYIAAEETVEVSADDEPGMLDFILSTGEQPQIKDEGYTLDGVAKLEGAIDHGGILVSIEGTSNVCVTDKDGRFQFTNLPQGVQRVAFHKEGYKMARIPADPARNTKPISITLPQLKKSDFGGSVEGMVQYDNGYLAGLAGVNISLIGPQTYQAKTQSNGIYQMVGVAPGIYRLDAEIDGYESYELLGIQVKQGEKSRVSNIIMQAIQEVVGEIEPSQLTGTAILDGEEEHQGIIVKLVGTQMMTSTDPDGTYKFSNVPSGVYELAFQHDGYKSDSITDVQVVQGQSLTLGPVRLYREREKPYVMYTEPSDGATRVPVREYIDVVVVFSTNMKGNSVKKAIKIVPDVAHTVFFGGENPQSDNDRAVIRMYKTRQPEIKFEQEYTITIASTAIDDQDVALEEPYQFKITTSGPLILSSIPRDGDEDVFFTVGDYIVLNFNTKVDYSTVMDSFRIRPKPESVPLLFPEASAAGNMAKIQTDFKDDTTYTVTVNDKLRSQDGARFDNTPYSFSFSTGSIQDDGDSNDDLIFTRPNQYK